MTWYFPLLVFLARIGDVSVGTLRIIYVLRGQRKMASLLSFLEATLWLFAVSTVMIYVQQHPWIGLFYAGGYATGTLVGMVFDDLLALGTQLVRVVNTDEEKDVSTYLRSKDYMLTEVETKGLHGNTEICLIVVPRKELNPLVRDIREYVPKAFVTIEDVRSSSSPTAIFRRTIDQVVPAVRGTQVK